MKNIEKFNNDRTVFSMEVFPPKKDSKVESIVGKLDAIVTAKPDYISITYGAGGNLANTHTRDVAALIQNKYGINAMAHLTCLTSSREQISAVLDDFKAHGIENILALRGDVNPDVSAKDDFRHACDLISAIKEKGDFGIAGACYPEGHTEAPNLIDDIRNLKYKVDCGCDYLVSQLFFENSSFLSFLEKARIAGINCPIEAGIMPVTNKSQIERMVAMSGAALPSKFTKMMAKYDSNPEALIDAGIAYAVDQIVDLIANGVVGIHLYVMNNPYLANKIKDSIVNLL